MNSSIHVIVPAAGSGQRFGGPVPKQYLALAGRTVIERTLEMLLEVTDSLILALAEDDHYWRGLPLAADHRIRVIQGGVTRSASVKNALRCIKSAQPNDWVLIHDSVRPLVQLGDIRRLLDELDDHPVGGLLAAPIFETVKRVDKDLNVTSTEDRDYLWTAQTPQLFRYQCLLDALEAVGSAVEPHTDEARALELAGKSVRLVEGSRTNIKITRPEDLDFASMILGQSDDSSDSGEGGGT